MLDAAALERVSERLESMGDRADRLAPYFRRVADDMRELNATRFRTARWAPLSPEYAARKAQRGKGRTAGRYTGTLEASMTRPGGRFGVERLDGDSVTVSTRAPHAQLFDQGRGGQPARDLNPRRVVVDRSALWLAWLASYVLDGEER